MLNQELINRLTKAAERSVLRVTSVPTPLNKRGTHQINSEIRKSFSIVPNIKTLS